MSILTRTNRLGFFEIRLESIGGLGANLAGKMLAETGVLGLGLNASNFSSYGSEKRELRLKASSASVSRRSIFGITVRLSNRMW